MMTNRPYCCGNCPGYVDFGDGSYVRPDMSDRRGQCRKNPPANDPGQKKWPEVYYLDFCLQHPSAPMTRKEQLLAQIASQLNSAEERAQRVIRVAPDRPL